MRKIVDPIKDKDQIIALENYLFHKSKRNRLLFVLGMNSGLRVSDLLNLNVVDVRDKSHVELVEKKTSKYKKFPLNRKLRCLIKYYTRNRRDNEPLFLSQKRYRLNQSQVYRMLKASCEKVGISEHIGTHTMRKTFGYHHYRQFKDIAMLQTIFNHSSPLVTLRYIGIEQDEIDQSYKQFKLGS